MKVSNEPIVWLAVLRAAIVLGTSFGLNLSPAQTGAIYVFAETVSTLFARQTVTPSSLADERVARGMSPTDGNMPLPLMGDVPKQKSSNINTPPAT